MDGPVISSTFVIFVLEEKFQRAMGANAGMFRGFAGGFI